MSWSTVHWKSTILNKQTSMEVILPDVGEPPYATLYLLHGLSDDSTTWLRRTRIEWYLRELPLIVVMPTGYRGFYTNNVEGPDYARVFGEELLAFVERTFHARPDRDARAIGGLSMGGYGALRIGLGYADKFCSIHSHSGAVGWGRVRGPADWRKAAKQLKWAPEFTAEMKRIFGRKAAGTDHDLLTLARRAHKAGNLPKLMLDCGSEDYLLEQNRFFHAQLEDAKIAHDYFEYPGAHTWDYWDEHIREALSFHATNLRLSRTQA